MARGPAQLVVAIVPLAATPPTLTWRIVSGVAVHEAERDDRGELRVGGLVDERDRSLNARLQLGWVGFAERERGVVIENAAVDADLGGVDGGDRGLRADEQFGAARRAALLAIRHRCRPGRS